MQYPIYLFSGTSGALFAARKLAEGDRYGPRYEFEVKTPAVLFYHLARPPRSGKEISPGHLHGHRLTDPVPLESFMKHAGNYALPPTSLSKEIDAGAVKAIQAYFTRTTPKPEHGSEDRAYP